MLMLTGFSPLKAITPISQVEFVGTDTLNVLPGLVHQVTELSHSSSVVSSATAVRETSTYTNNCLTVMNLDMDKLCVLSTLRPMAAYRLYRN